MVSVVMSGPIDLRPDPPHGAAGRAEVFQQWRVC